MANASEKKPQPVKRAVICLWTSAALTLVAAGSQVFDIGPTPGALIEVMSGITTAGLMTFVALELARRRGWARWLFFVLYMLGSFVFVVSLIFAPWVFVLMPPLAKGFAILQLGLQTLALAFMFGRMSREWFKEAPAL